MELDLAHVLSDLVALPSVNPMGQSASGPEFFEYRVTDYLEKFFRDLGLRFARQSVAPQRDNIIARLEGAADKPIVLWEAHQDTVPVTGMTIDPWNPQVRGGKLYGRGSCDIKGGMTAMLGALARLADEPPNKRSPILMACTVNEENGFTGATALTGLWSRPDSIIPRRPESAIVAEPTSLDVVVAHKGVVRWKIHTRGRAAHSSQPESGENAIFKMAHVLNLLERFQKEVAPSLAAHPLCGRPSLSVGTITGGISVNTVPDYATIEVERRLTPGEDPALTRRQVIEFLDAQLGALARDVNHEDPYIVARGLTDDHNGGLAGRLATAAASIRGSCRQVGVDYGTDAGVLAAAGIPTVVFGPGSIAQAHTADEWVQLSEVEQAREILCQFVRTG